MKKKKLSKYPNKKYKEKKISAIILVGVSIDKKLYERCLDSIFWCDEVVKVETDKVNGSFADWRNFGAQKATSEWLFYIDTDEEVTSELKDEILTVVKDYKFPAYAILRKNIVLGKELRHGGFGRFDYVKRLFLKKNFVKWTGELHEEPFYYFNSKLTNGSKGTIGKLVNKLNHTKAQKMEEMILKTNIWSEVEAKLMLDAKHPQMNYVRFLSAGWREFFFRFIKHKSYKDGDIGVIHGFYQIWSRLISYMKLWEKQIQAAKKM